MFNVSFRIPTSISDVKTLFKEKQDQRYNHNVQVVRNMYNEMTSILNKQRGFKESKELKGCLIRGIKAID